MVGAGHLGGSLRLALLAPGEIFGGAERQMLTLCAWLEQRGIHPAVILFHDALLASALRRAGIDPLIVHSRSAFSMAAVSELRRHLCQTNINVLHFHGYKAAVHAWLATRGRRLSIIKTEHGAVETQSNTLRERGKTAAYRIVDTFATRQMKAEIVYVTRELERHFSSAHRGLSRSVIYNGIEPPADRQTQRPAEYRSTAKNVLVLGRLEQVKGIEYAVRALADRSMPAEVMLHIVGEGPLREPLEQLAHRQAVRDRVFFHGFRRDAQDYMAHADALLVPSMHEGLPYVLLEAMSLRVPVVATAVGGLQEVLTDGATALLIPPADPAAIARALARLLETPALGEQLQAGASQLARETFCAAAMGERYLALYERALSGRNGPSGRTRGLAR